MSEEVVTIDIDDLGVDTANIRGGEWSYNEEFVQDIKKNKVSEPLIVRPADPSSGVRYAIVCGSRRYNAAIEAGLKEVPCIVREMDDITAMGRSIAENIYKESAPAWRYAVKIGEMYERLNHKGEKEDVMKIIMAKTGFSRTSVQNYLDIAGLPGEIIELMKEPEKRSKIVKELLKGMPVTGTDKVLSVDKAAKIARELKDFSLKKMFEVAAYTIQLSKETAFEIIERVKSYPKMAMEELHEMVSKIPKGVRWAFYFGSHIVRALDEACIRKNMDKKRLVEFYVEDGLRRDGYL